MSKFQLKGSVAFLAFQYIRCSTTEQAAGDSLHRQKALGAQYAAKNGYDLPEVNIIEDIGFSGFTGENLKSGKLGIFVKKVTSGKIPAGSVLLLESFDRASRQSPIDALTLIYDLLQRGIIIVTLCDERVYDKTTCDLGTLVTSLVTISRANEESTIKSMRLSEAWKRKRARAKEKNFQEPVPNG